MRIGIDARELLGHRTGVGRYLEQLLREWAAPDFGVAGRHDFVLYAHGPLGEEILRRCESLRPTLRIVPGGGGAIWEQVSLGRAARADRLDVFFAPGYTAPLTPGCPVVLTVHDLSFYARPEWFRWREGLRRRLLTGWSARRAACVLTDSQFSAGEVERHLGVPMSSMRVIPLGVTPPLAVGADIGGEPDSGPAGALREPMVLYVGSVFNRRHVPDVIRAFARVAAKVPGARLEVIGENRTYPYEDLQAVCRTAGVAGCVTLRAWATEAELAAAYRRAAVFVFLSEYEGFGLTPLEALACGIPAVVLDTPVAREVCGPAAVYVRAGDLEGTASAIQRLMSDAGSRVAQLEAARGVLRRYTWRAAARQTFAALEGAGA